MTNKMLRLLAVCAGLLPLAAYADVWGYVDDTGMTHFADRKLDGRYQLYFKTANVQFDPRKVMMAQERSAARRQATNVGSLAFNPVADAAAGTKARRLVAMINQSRSYRAISQHMQREAGLHGVDVDLVKAIVAAESGFNSAAVSSAGAVGLMQIMPATARDLGVQDDARLTVEQKLADPALNVKLGTRYIKFLINKFPGRLDLAVAAYNAGHGAVQRAGNAVPRYAETQNYVRTVMALYQTMKPGGVDAVYAGASPIPLGRVAKNGHGGRVSMTIASSKTVPRHYKIDGGVPAAAELALAPAELTVDNAATAGPSAMDIVASKLAEADATTLGNDVVIKSSAAAALSTP